MLLRRHFTLAALCTPAALQAQTVAYPSKLVRFVVPVSAGSATDVVVRTVVERLQEAGGFQAIVENKVGGGTTIGAYQVATAMADGYTVLANSNAQTTAPFLYRKLPFDASRDFVGVAPLASLANLLIVPAQAPWRAVPDLVAAVRAKKASMNYASAGYGTGTHLNAEKFRSAANLSGEHVPYKGTPEAIAAVAAGDVDWFFAPGVSAQGAIRGGHVRALAVGASRKSVHWPDLPSTEEAVPGSGYEFWTGLFLPARTPATTVLALNRAINTALDGHEVRTRFAGFGAEPLRMDVEGFQRFLREEQDGTAALVKAARIQPIE